MSEDRLKVLIDLAQKSTPEQFLFMCPGGFFEITIPGGDDDYDDVEFFTKIQSKTTHQIDSPGTQLPKKATGDAQETAPGTYMYELKKGSGNGWLQWIAVGRASNNDVILRHQSVSKLHAKIHAQKEGITNIEPTDELWITDMKSSAGTWINSVMLKPSEPKQLSIGDVVRFGQVDCKFLRGEALYHTIRSKA